MYYYHAGIRLSEGTNFTLVNSCNETIWPGITANYNSTGDDGFALKPGQSSIFSAPSGWGGRMWARTGCDFNQNTSTGKCQTGGCDSSLKCSGPGNPPFSIAEFNLGDIDYYDVSLVDGFNLPLTITPVKGNIYHIPFLRSYSCTISVETRLLLICSNIF